MPQPPFTAEDWRASAYLARLRSNPDPAPDALLATLADAETAAYIRGLGWRDLARIRQLLIEPGWSDPGAIARAVDDDRGDLATGEEVLARHWRGGPRRPRAPGAGPTTAP